MTTKASVSRQKVSTTSAVVTVVVSCVLILLIGEAFLRLFTPSLLAEMDEGLRTGKLEISENKYLGWQNSRGQDHNSHRMRDDEYNYIKPPNTLRVAVLGDSVTYGMGVRRPYIFSDVLESLLNERANARVEVLNFGVIAYNTFQVYADLADRVLKFDPDKVVFVFTTDDIETTPVVLKINGSYYLNRNSLEGWSLFNNDVHWELYRLSWLYRLFFERINQIILNPEDFEELTIDTSVALANVKRMAEICAQHSVDFLLVLHPPLLPNDAAWRSSRYAKYFEVFRQEAKKSGLAMLDLDDIYSGHGDAIKLHGDDNEHPNALGHRLIAERLARQIRADDFIKPMN